MGTIKSGESLPDSGNDNFKTTFGLSQTVDKGHECHMMFVAFSMQIFNEIVEIPTLKMIFMV